MRLCNIIAKAGQDCNNDFGSKRLNEIVASIRKDLNLPLRLVCNTTSTYDYQNPGHSDDTPEGILFNIRRDLKILQMLGLVPGDTRPALELFNRFFENIKTAKDILWLEEITSETWKGEPKNDYYEKQVNQEWELRITLLDASSVNSHNTIVNAPVAHVFRPIILRSPVNLSARKPIVDRRHAYVFSHPSQGPLKRYGMSTALNSMRVNL